MIRLPTIFRGSRLIAMTATNARAAFAAADIAGTKLLDAMNLLRKDVNESIGALSTGEVSPIYFEDVTFSSDSTTRVVLRHGLGRRVRWSIVDWQNDTFSSPSVWRDASQTDNDTLVLQTGSDGVATIRVW